MRACLPPTPTRESLVHTSYAVPVVSTCTTYNFAIAVTGRHVAINEDYSRSDTDGAWILWSGGLMLAELVQAAFDAGVLKPPLTTVELGAGSGLVSLVGGALGLRCAVNLCPGRDCLSTIWHST
eukprot:COSAG01_NODE_4849_length_4684_cov_12.227263_3_plen_124_part_00